MHNTREAYVREMFREFGYLATWHPGEQLRLGDVGIVRRNLFTRFTTLKDKGIGFKCRPDVSTENLEYISTNNVSISFKASGSPALPGSVIPIAQAGAIIEFGESGGIVFQAYKCVTPSIDDQDLLGSEIIRRWRAGAWDKGHVVITELIQAESGTVIVSKGSNGKIEIVAEAQVSATSFKIGDATLNLGVAFQNNIGVKIVGGKGLTPLFKAKGIQTSLFSPPEFRDRGFSRLDTLTPADASEQTLLFDEIPFEEISD